MITRRVFLGVLCLVMLSGGVPGALANGFTLEQVLSSPFPADLTASPSGSCVAWSFDAAGRRNLWVAEAPYFKGRQLTRYTTDDGQELAALQFSPDGSLIAFVRGGPPNTEKEIPNPTSDPAGAKEEVYVVSVRTGVVIRIAEGGEPFFSPRGDRLFFVREGKFWSAPVSGGPARQEMRLRGQVSSPEWSPDGTRLAFVTTRGDHSFVALYELAARRIEFVEPSYDRDLHPRWSPDGKRIAFIRVFNVTDTYTADRERLVPWSIRVAAVGSGAGREIWRSGAAEVDSYSPNFGDDVLQWAAGDRLVFGSEQDGWAHLYSIPANGGAVTALTPGDYEVENVTWSRDRTFVIVAANAGDIDRRHLWKVSVTGGEPTAITKGAAIEMYPVFCDGDRRIAFLGSTARDPLMPLIASADGSGVRPLAAQALAASFPRESLVEPEQVLFKAADGMTIHGQMFRPRNGSGRMPAVVFMHGGPQRQMLLGWHYRYYYHNSYAFNQYLASRGYVVLSVNFRSGIGYGRAFREARHRGQRGASEYQDIVAAAKYLGGRGDVDAKRIGLWGGSYGGYLTAMGLARNSDLFAAGVDLHGVHDWSARVGRAPWATGSPELVRLGRDSSPISAVDKWKSPVLLIHGDDDRNVAFSQTVDLVRRLRDRGVEFEEMVFPDEVHDFLLHRHWLRVYAAAAGFFDRKLK